MNKLRTDPIEKGLRTRPFALWTLCFAAGLLIGQSAPGLLMIWAAGGAAVLLGLLIFRKKALICPLAVLLGAAWIGLLLMKPAPVSASDVLLSGRVDGEATRGDDSVGVLLTDVTLEGEAYPAKVMAYLYGNAPDLLPGDRITVRANVFPPKDVGGADYESWLWRSGAALTASASLSRGYELERAEGFSLARRLAELRRFLCRTISSIYDDDCEGIAMALVVGDRSEMPETLRDSFYRTGVSHLLALSGLHVGALFMGVEWIFRRLRLSRRRAFALSVTLMSGYAALVGLPASILRAGIMYTLSRLGRLTGRPRDSLTTLCAALLILLLVNPLSIGDVGLQLSFTAVAGLILFAGGWPDRASGWPDGTLSYWVRRGLRGVGRMALASMAAQIGTLPVIVSMSNCLPVWFLPFNMLLIPMMTLLFPLLALSALAGCAFLPAGRLLALPAQAVIRLFARITAFGASLPHALLITPDWPPILIAAFAVLALAASPYVPSRHLNARRLTALGLMIALIPAGILLPRLKNAWHSGLEITFLDVGQGDAALIRADGRCYLIDVGDGGAVADYLLRRGIQPDGIFLSHGHADHAGGLRSLIEVFPPCPLYVSCLWREEARDAGVDAAWTEAVAAGWPVYELRQGDRLTLSESVSGAVWAPSAETGAALNENCLVLSVSCGQSTALFMGDLPMEGERIPLPDCTVLKVGHHGSAGSTSRLLLEQTTPAAAIISVGRNSYGHPADSVLERLSGTAVYRTDECGSITVEMRPDGETRVRTGRGKEDS